MALKNQKHQKSFEEWLFSKFTKKATSFVLTLAEVESVRDVLKGLKTITDAYKRHHFKSKRYSLNEEGIACRTEASTNPTSKKKTGPDVNLPVVWIEAMFENY